MKHAARLAVLGVTVAFVSQSCGSSDGKKAAPRADGGESSQAGSPGMDAGGQPGTAGERGAVAGSSGDMSSAGEASIAGAAGSSPDCPAGFDECDGDPSEVCEQDLSVITSCGDCETACTNEHGGIVCEDFACVVTSCADGYDDCNGDPSDGCETLLTDNDQHCGACGRDCTSVDAMCMVDSCGDIRMQDNLSLGTGNGPFNDRAFAFSTEIGIANMTRTNSVVRLFPLDGSPGKVIWDSTGGESGNETLLILGQEVIWAQRGTPNLVRKKLASAASADLPTDVFFPDDLPVYLRAQGEYFYWISGDYGEPGYVYRRRRDAAIDVPDTRLVEVPQGTSQTISGFAVTTDAIYWVTSEDGNAATPATEDNVIRTTPLEGGVPSIVPKAPGAADAIIKDFGNFTISPSLQAVGDTLYFARTIGETPLNGVYRFKKGDAAPTKLAEGENVTTFAVGEAFIYYGLLNQQGVWRAPLAGGQGVKVGQSYQTSIVGLDDTFAYVAFVNQPAYLYKIFQ